MYKPILDRILCKDCSVSKQFDSAGMIIPDQLQVPSYEAEVLAVGSGVYLGGVILDMPIKVGDKVKYNPYAADFQISDNEMWTQGAEFLIRVADIRGVWENAETVQ